MNFFLPEQLWKTMIVVGLLLIGFVFATLLLLIHPLLFLLGIGGGFYFDAWLIKKLFELECIFDTPDNHITLTQNLLFPRKDENGYTLYNTYPPGKNFKLPDKIEDIRMHVDISPQKQVPLEMGSLDFNDDTGAISASFRWVAHPNYVQAFGRIEGATEDEVRVVINQKVSDALKSAIENVAVRWGVLQAKINKAVFVEQVLQDFETSNTMTILEKYGVYLDDLTISDINFSEQGKEERTLRLKLQSRVDLATEMVNDGMAESKTDAETRLGVMAGDIAHVHITIPGLAQIPTDQQGTTISGIGNIIGPRQPKNKKGGGK